MTFGIMLSAFNAKYFKKKIDLYAQFIPQMLFLQSIFGYMCFLIVLKWVIQWDTNQAPRLLNLMIDMILQPWAFPAEYQMFPGQVWHLSCPSHHTSPLSLVLLQQLFTL